MASAIAKADATTAAQALASAAASVKSEFPQGVVTCTTWLHLHMVLPFANEVPLSFLHFGYTFRWWRCSVVRLVIA